MDTKKTLLSFKKNFKMFREYALPTKREFEMQMCNEMRDYIYTTLEKIEQDGHVLTDDSYVWDSYLVEDLVKKIVELNARLKKVEEDTRTINRRQEAL